MYDGLRAVFIKRLTVDSPHRDRRRKDFNAVKDFTETGKDA